MQINDECEEQKGTRRHHGGARRGEILVGLAAFIRPAAHSHGPRGGNVAGGVAEPADRATAAPRIARCGQPASAVSSVHDM